MPEKNGECVYLFGGFLVFIIILFGFNTFSHFRGEFAGGVYHDTSNSGGGGGPQWNYATTTYPTGYSSQSTQIPFGYGYPYGMPQYMPYAGYAGLPNYTGLVAPPVAPAASGGVSRFCSSPDCPKHKADLMAASLAEATGINVGNDYTAIPDHSWLSNFYDRIGPDSEYFPYEYNYPLDYAYSYNLS